MITSLTSTRDDGHAPSQTRAAPVQPADLIFALTGLALLFFALFVYAVANWNYLGPDTDDVSILGWAAPLAAGGLCLLIVITTATLRALRARQPRSE